MNPTTKISDQQVNHALLTAMPPEYYPNIHLLFIKEAGTKLDCEKIFTKLQARYQYLDKMRNSRGKGAFLTGFGGRFDNRRNFNNAQWNRERGTRGREGQPG